MSTYIQKNGEKAGPFSDDRILSAIWVGIYSPADLAWREGMADWQPLGSLYTPAQMQPPPAPVPRYPEDSAGMRFLMPVGRSAWAIAAGYLGLFSVLVLPAPFAVAVSLVAIRDIHKSRAAGRPLHGMGRVIFGLVMGGLGTGVLLFFLVQMVRV